ncbi:hypothetical protein BSL78_04931 [Apostichopus japonicus]|uniref:NACHT domain-containing protein n=1 Tax=Stichopus japonicus TaxID=307972 RepID=A0A2G8LD19_STIJA|nr:hypothetical protein BSL78_04931 [Apostichopus japonicus]
MSRHFIFEQRQPEQPNVLLIGQSGSGKTTVCYRLLHDWLTRNEDSSISDFDLVVYTSLSHVSITDSLVDSIRHNLLSADTDLTDGDIDGIIKSHVDSLLLIFDSLDDINLTDLDLTDHSTTLTIGKLLTSDQLPLVTKLITSSSSAVDDLFHGLDVHIAGLDNAQMRDYVARYFLNEPMIGANILHHITKSVVTSDFCRLPLLLRMVCDIAKRPNSINIAEVMHMHVFYSFVIQNEFGKYCEEHGADSAYFVQFSRLLGHLALEMLLKNQSVDFQEKRILTADERAMIGLGLKAGFVKQVEVVSRGLDGSVNRVTFIRFKYMVIQQFFAAARLAEIADECPERFETILDNITKVPSLHYLMLFLCGNSAPCCRAILKRVHKQEEFRLLMSEYLYEYQEADDECSQILSVLRWLNTNICFRGDQSQYQQRATFSLVQRMKNAKINISSVHLNDVTSSLCLELMKVGAPILSLTISDVALTLFRDLPACPSLRKLQISEVDVNDEDLLQVFKWVAKQPKLICLVQLSEIANLTKCKVFKEEDGDSLSIYSQLNSETYQWHFTSALDFCKYQFENGLMHEMELRRRTKQPNLISEKYLDANCIPHTNCDDSFVVPEIVLEDLDGEYEEEAQETGNETQWTEDHESLLAAQQSLHAGKVRPSFHFVTCG